MTQPEVSPPDWIVNVPSTPAVHDEPPPAYGWEGISDTALQGIRKNLIEAIVGLIGQLPDIALNLIRQLITMIDNAEDLIFEIVNMVLGWITQAPELIITVIETILAWFVEVPELVISVVNAFVGIITDLPDVIVTIIDALLEWITSIPDLIITVINTFLSWITDSDDLIITVVEAGLQWLIDVPEMVTSIVEAFLGFITSIPDVTQAIVDSLDSWVDSIPGFITDLVGAFLGWIRDVPGLLVGVVERIIEWLTDDDEGLVATIVTSALGWVTEIPDLISLLINTWITWITEAPGAALDFISSVLLPFGLFDNIPIIKLIEQLLTGTYTEEEFNASFPVSFPNSFGYAGTPELPTFAKFIQSFLKLFNVVDWLSPSFNPLDAVTDIINLILKPTDLLAWLDPITGLLPDFQAPKIFNDFVTVIQKTLMSIPGGGLISGVVGIFADFVNALLGIGPGSTPAYTPENAAVANLQGQISALLADSDPATTGFFDGFNTPPTLSANWTNIAGPMDAIDEKGAAWHPTGYNAKRYNAARPGTVKWQVQASIFYKAGKPGSKARVLGGMDTTGWTRFPAIELDTDPSGDNIRLVSLAGSPSTAANASIGRMEHGARNFGYFYLKDGDVLALEVDEASKIYKVYLNPGGGSQPIITYDDSIANLIPRGVGHRDAGFQFNYTNNPDPGQGSGWDNMTCFDRVT